MVARLLIQWLDLSFRRLV